jgi:group I intron endonuclease
MPEIYKIKCIPNNKVYIGSTICLKRRWETHRDTLKRGVHHSKILQNSWNKYGKESFSFEIIEKVNKQNMLEREQFWIEFYKATDRKYGFNHSSNVFSGSWLTNNKLVEKEVIEIFNDIDKGYKRSDIAKKFNISKQTIHDIACGRSWGYIPRNKIRIRPPLKISDKAVEEIKNLLIEGYLQVNIANSYNINQSTVSRIFNGLRRSKIIYYKKAA